MESIANDLLGLGVGESDSLEVSGKLLLRQCHVWLNSTEVAPRRPLHDGALRSATVCQMLKGRIASISCRTDEVGVGAGRRWSGRPTWFAAELLMPEKLVRAEFTGTMNGMAECFGVSAEAMGWRLYDLALVAATPSDLA